MKAPPFDVYCYNCICSRCKGRDVYVGKAKNGLSERDNAHILTARKILNGIKSKRFLKFEYFMAAHGIENCKVRLLGSFSSENEMNDAEVNFISTQKTSHIYGGMNFDKGGRGGRTKGVYSPTQSARENQSKSLLEFYENNQVSSETKQLLSKKKKNWCDKNPEKVELAVQKTWETIFAKLAIDSQYAELFYKNQKVKAILGGAAFLEKMVDKEFAREFSKKVSDNVVNWCSKNQEICKLRAKKGVETRKKNGTQFDMNANVSTEERRRRALKSWETRRKNKRQGIKNDE